MYTKQEVIQIAKKSKLNIKLNPDAFNEFISFLLNTQNNYYNTLKSMNYTECRIKDMTESTIQHYIDYLNKMT